MRNAIGPLLQTLSLCGFPVAILTFGIFATWASSCDMTACACESMCGDCAVEPSCDSALSGILMLLIFVGLLPAFVWAIDQVLKSRWKTYAHIARHGNIHVLIDEQADPKTDRARVDAAKHGLGERGPVWWDDGAPD